MKQLYLIISIQVSYSTNEFIETVLNETLSKLISRAIRHAHSGILLHMSKLLPTTKTR